MEIRNKQNNMRYPWNCCTQDADKKCTIQTKSDIAFSVEYHCSAGKQLTLHGCCGPNFIIYFLSLVVLILHLSLGSWEGADAIVGSLSNSFLFSFISFIKVQHIL